MSHRSWRLCVLLSVLLSCGLASTEADDSLELVDFQALRLAIRDLSNTYPRRYTKGEAYLRQLEEYEKRLPQIRKGLKRGDAKAISEARQILALKREALLANPLLDFERLLLIRRKPLGDPRRAKADGKGLGKVLGLPQQSSWQLDTMPNTLGWENDVAALSPVRPEGSLSTIYRPASPRLVSDIELHFDARKLMFSMPDDDRLWQIFEIDLDDGKLRQISRGDQPEVHNFDSCYLPSGKIAFISTASLQGVPCNDAIVVGLTYVMDGNGQDVRQLCFDQDHNYCPTVMNDGRILYLRWEYADLPHHWPRILFTMNPDGTGQREFYGSGSYWPNAVFYARPIPNHPTKVAGIITGHHVGRVGELIVFDPARGRQEADGVVQRIPGRGKPVEPLIMDKLTLDTWPKFLHPYPLSEKYFIVSCKPTPDDLWGIYLVDVFDNLTLIKEEEGPCLLEPIPIQKRRPPPVIPQKAEPGLADALVFLEDVYSGVDDRLETVVDAGAKNAATIHARPVVAKALPEASLRRVHCPDWPLEAAEAARRQTALGMAVRRYRPNAWGLHDMHGNVWQWTRSAVKPYPYRADDGRNDPADQGRRVVRGGSWYDRPDRCRSAFRLSYPAWRKVYNVGFRVVCQVEGDTEGHFAKAAD